jgi:hypothetical protein
MQDAAELLSRDFGFRAAVATGDQATATSALENLKRRRTPISPSWSGVDASVHGDVSPAARRELAGSGPRSTPDKCPWRGSTARPSRSWPLRS